MSCPACGNTVYTRCGAYNDCTMCYTIYTLDNIQPETENENPESRNTADLYQTRLNRVIEAIQYTPEDAIDFGAGIGEFTSWLFNRGIITDSIDKDGPQLEDIDWSVNVIFMVEVIEHLTDPKATLKEMETKLDSWGCIYIETTFADQIDALPHPYVDHRIGHRTILSIKGLEIVAKAAGLEIHKKINDNVVILKKIK